MSLKATARADISGSNAGRVELGGAAAGLWLHDADPAAARDLRRADDMFPFTPDTFLDELVGLCAFDDKGVGLTAAEFRALPAPARGAIIAALLRTYAGTEMEQALPRHANESDAAFLLRAWRQDQAHTAMAEPVTITPRADAPANDAAPAIIAAPVKDRLEESASQPAPEAPAASPAIETPPAVTRPQRRANGSRAALFLATMACLLAIATLGVSMAMLLRQDGVDQAMMRSMRDQQDQMMTATKANQAAIATLTAEVKALRHPATAAPVAAPDTPPLRPRIRTAARRLPPIYPDTVRDRDADDFP
jgi:hypothetical protein